MPAVIFCKQLYFQVAYIYSTSTAKDETKLIVMADAVVNISPLGGHPSNSWALFENYKYTGGPSQPLISEIQSNNNPITYGWHIILCSLTAYLAHMEKHQNPAKYMNLGASSTLLMP